MPQTRRLTPYQFFVKHAGYSYHPATETPAQGQRRGARALAAAEAWLAEQPGHEIRWVDDPDADRSWLEPDDGRPLYGCVVTVRNVDARGDDVRSLWGIDLGPNGDLGDPYTRVVVAELASQMMST